MVSFWPFGSADTSPASFEKTLSALSTKITSTQTTLDKTRAAARRVKVLLVLYLGFAWLVYAVVQLAVVKYWNMGAAEWAGMAGGPILIVLLRKLVGAYFTYRTDTLSKRLKDQTEERAKTIQKLKDATKYDSTMELIEKYGGEKKKDPAKDDKAGGQQQNQNHPNRPPANRTGLPPPPTANIQRSVSGPLPVGLSPVGPNSGPSSPDPSLEAGAEFAPNAFSDAPMEPPSFTQQQHPQGHPPQGYPAAPMPIESHWYDRIFDVLLGEDETAPKNRIVLICQSCRLVNGQAPPGTRSLAELGVWRCMACHAQNGEADEGKRIVEQVLASSSADADTTVEEQIKSEEREIEPVDVSGDGKDSATGVESHEGATKRRVKNGK